RAIDLDSPEPFLERARERTPERAVNRWIRFDRPAVSATVIRVREQAENTTRAAEAAKSRMRPAVIAGEPIVLDFTGVEICTQSFLHALLFDTVRLAWATRNAIHVIGAEPPVRSGIEFLENYALAG